MNRSSISAAFWRLSLAASLCVANPAFAQRGKAAPEKPYAQRKLNVAPKHILTNSMVHYDYPIVYVKAPRKGDKTATRWADIGAPFRMEPNSPLMLLQPDGKEEVLVPVKADEAIIDPMVSFDGQTVYYARLHGAHLVESGTVLRYAGADIYKIHVPTRKIVRLTHQEYTPNREGGKKETAPPVYNTGPCPAPGGKIVFTSTRNGYRSPRNGPNVPQLFVMDDDGSNVEQIGHLNIAGALHPVILKDGRIMFSSLESQGLRSGLAWGIWTIHPDGSNWGPLLSAFRTNTFHFQTQLSDGSLVVEEYYISNNFGFGGYHKFPIPAGPPAFASAASSLPFQPQGFQSQWTRFAEIRDELARLSDPSDPKSTRVGKVTHPSAAPDNHCLTVWSPGPVNRQNLHHLPAVDAGIYLILSSSSVEGPGEMLHIKNDPDFNEQWPRALVPYKRIYGIDEPPRLPARRNDGKQCKHLPEGTPFGLVGTSSLYKRESFARGKVPEGKVTASYAGGKDPLRGLDPFYRPISGDLSTNWTIQGADAGLYDNSEIHAIRILAMEPTSAKSGRRFFNYPLERLRILGEIPVRKFDKVGAPSRAAPESGPAGVLGPTDPDGNPDTSFLARIPADIAWTFQTLDRDGMVLNMAQTWHQLRPGEIRTDCGGCHAHSQKPTRFADTLAARPDYAPWDLTQKTPLLTTKKDDQSGKRWDIKDETGLRYDKHVKDVEFQRDIRPILRRSCVACHTKNWEKPAGNLVLDDHTGIRIEFAATMLENVPGDYFRLALDRHGRFGPKSVYQHGYGISNGSRYVRMMQARRSLLVWKLHGRRTDGLSNDDLPTETMPGDPRTLRLVGKPVPATPANLRMADLDNTGSAMPPPEAVAGTYVGPDGGKIKVEPVTDEDRRTIVRWIDLGCPIDLSQDPKNPGGRVDGGWLYDDQRPTLTLTLPQTGTNKSLLRILIGMHDYGTGLDMDTFHVSADFPVDGLAAGENLAPRFRSKSEGVWEFVLATPVTRLARGRLTVSVKDRQGNMSRSVRSFSVESGQ